METITNEKEQIEEIFTEEALHQRHVSDFISTETRGGKFQWVFFRVLGIELYLGWRIFLTLW